MVSPKFWSLEFFFNTHKRKCLYFFTQITAGAKSIGHRDQVHRTKNPVAGGTSELPCLHTQPSDIANFFHKYNCFNNRAIQNHFVYSKAFSGNLYLTISRISMLATALLWLWDNLSDSRPTYSSGQPSRVTCIQDPEHPLSLVGLLRIFPHVTEIGQLLLPLLLKGWAHTSLYIIVFFLRNLRPWKQMKYMWKF